jgi:hypothetical protein
MNIFALVVCCLTVTRIGRAPAETDSSVKPRQCAQNAAHQLPFRPLLPLSTGKPQRTPPLSAPYLIYIHFDI